MYKLFRFKTLIRHLKLVHGALKIKDHQTDKPAVTEGNASCRDDNSWCHQRPDSDRGDLSCGRAIASSSSFHYPRTVLASGYCRCLRPSITKFVRAITHHPFMLGSPNLDQRCKIPWLRSLLFFFFFLFCFFLGGGSLTFKVKVKFYPILNLSAP